MNPQVTRTHTRSKCGLCRNGEPSSPFFYDERGGVKAKASIRETELCVDCLQVLHAAFSEAEMSKLSSLKPLREHSLVGSWLASKSIRNRLTSVEFFEERRRCK